MAIDFEPQFDFQPIATQEAPKESPKFYELEKQAGTPKNAGELISQIGRQFKEAATSPMPGSLLSLPIKAVSETAQQAGSEVAKRTKDAIGTVPARLAGFATSAALDPTSYVPVGEMAKPFTASLSEAVASRLPKIFKVLGNVPEQATETLLKEGGALPEASKAALGSAVQDVQEAFSKVKSGTEIPQVPKAVKEAITAKVQAALKGAVDERGAALNAAKKSVGLPVTPDEKVLSLKNNGNEFGLTHADLMKSDSGEAFAAPAYKWADQGNTQYYKLYGDKKQILEKTLGSHVHGSDVPQEVVDKFKLPVKESPFLKDAKSPQDLAVLVDDFKRAAPDLNDAQRVKTASYLQDKINGMVDWQKTGNSTEGILKTQYKDLQELGIPEALKDSKGRMKESLDLLHDLGNKLGKEPGRAQAFLEKLFTKDTPQNQDYLKKLAKLETVSNQPVLSSLKAAFTLRTAPQGVTDLVKSLNTHLGQGPGKAQDFLQRIYSSDKGTAADFANKLDQVEKVSGKKVVDDLKKQLAAHAFAKITSRPGLEVAQAAHGAIWGMFGHPGVTLATAVGLAAQSPKVLAGLVKAGIKTPVVKPAALAAMQLRERLDQSSASALQSVKDRLKNASK